jgi:hypothetical protein
LQDEIVPGQLQNSVAFPSHCILLAGQEKRLALQPRSSRVFLPLTPQLSRISSAGNAFCADLYWKPYRVGSAIVHGGPVKAC